jgi:hypothetical protein
MILKDYPSPKTIMFVEHILRGAFTDDQRTGQWMFNHLPLMVAARVSGTSFDPFHKNLSAHEIYDWIDNHLIFDGNEIVGLFHNDILLWEK